jgi:hypothetical protein
VRALGPQATAISDRSRAALLFDCWRCALLHNIAPKAYFKFSLFLRDHLSRVHCYVQDHEASVLLREARLRIDPATVAKIDDKTEFASFCQKASLPTAGIVASCLDGFQPIWFTSGAGLTGDLVLKLTDRAAGEGFEVAEWDVGSGCWVIGVDCLNLSGLADYLMRKSRGGGAIIQRRLVNHAAIRPLAGRGLSTLRVVTAILPDQSIDVAAAAMRMPTGSSYVDNIAAGGLAAPIDTASGTLGVATGKDITLGWFSSHPDTGASIVHFAVPHWRAACALCLRAHLLLPAAPSIGWDVVVTDEGPKLLEANLGWDVELAQMLGQTAIGQTTAATALHAKIFGERANPTDSS